MTTMHIDIDLDESTVEVVKTDTELDISVDSPSVDIGVPGLRGATGYQIVFGAKGPVFPGIGTFPFYPRIDGRIVRVTASCATQTSGATVVDVNIDDVSIYTDQSQRPALAGTGRHFDDGGTIGAGAFTATQAITVDRDSAGVGATDLLVTVDYE
jgi:hypothetical protein